MSKRVARWVPTDIGWDFQVDAEVRACVDQQAAAWLAWTRTGDADAAGSERSAAVCYPEAVGWLRRHGELDGVEDVREHPRDR